MGLSSSERERESESPLKVCGNSAVAHVSAAFTQRVGDLADVRMPPAEQTGPHAASVGRNPGAALPDRERRGCARDTAVTTNSHSVETSAGATEQSPFLERVSHLALEPNPALVEHAKQRADSVQNRIADRITAFT